MITLPIVVIALVTFVAGIGVGTLIARPATGKQKTSRSAGKGRNKAKDNAVELYVGNLPYATTEKELIKAFQRFGRVLSVRLIEDRHDGRPKGFGFVEMESLRTANAAIKAMHGKGFKGRDLVVNEARSRARDN